MSANARRLTLAVLEPSPVARFRNHTRKRGQAVASRHVSGEMALRYGELHSYDANEQALPAQLRVEGGRVTLEVEDGRAVYLVTIDPPPGTGPGSAVLASRRMRTFE